MYRNAHCYAHADGRIDANEIQTIVTTLVAEKFKSKAFKIGLIILAIFTTILLGAMFGLTWAVVAALKDTQVWWEGRRAPAYCFAHQYSFLMTTLTHVRVSALHCVHTWGLRLLSHSCGEPLAATFEKYISPSSCRCFVQWSRLLCLHS